MLTVVVRLSAGHFTGLAADDVVVFGTRECMDVFASMHLAVLADLELNMRLVAPSMLGLVAFKRNNICCSFYLSFCMHFLHLCFEVAVFRTFAGTP